MRYFNGFSLRGEEAFFKAYLVESELCVAGFSYGAQQAFEYVYTGKKRVDRLILLSPAFFQTEGKSFIRAQLHYFEADSEQYLSRFLKNTAYPFREDLSAYGEKGTKEALSSLLSYRWEREKIETVLARGTVIEVFMGGKDKIVDTRQAYDFFSGLATCYYIKNAGHLLQIR